MDPLSVAIGVGLVISLLFSELFGLAAGGMVVPGYFALALSSPVDLGLTLLTGFITFAFVHALASVIIVYGRRRTVLMILVGYLVGALIRNVAGDFEPGPGGDYTVIGYIIPGLIAIWMERQGIVETISALLTAAVVIRLVLILLGVEVTA